MATRRRQCNLILSLYPTNTPNPKVKKEFQIRTFQDVIDFHQSCLVSLTDVNDRNQESESARAKRLAENEANLEQIRIRAARREYE